MYIYIYGALLKAHIAIEATAAKIKKDYLCYIYLSICLSLSLSLSLSLYIYIYI